MPEPLHRRRPRSLETLCGVLAKSVRTTGSDALTSCKVCLGVLQAAENELVRQRTEDFVRRMGARYRKDPAPEITVEADPTLDSKL